MDKTKLIIDLQQKEELDPIAYDGSYEIGQELIKCYSQMSDLSVITVDDLNALYLAIIGSWKINVEKKKEKINATNLSDEAKHHMVSIIDKVWDKVCFGEYLHKKNLQKTDKPILGMFGTGFMAFKTPDNEARAFIKMCVDIYNSSTENEALDIAEEVLSKGISGMKAASVSVILHIIKPFVFPIINSNAGKGTIFEALGLDLDKLYDETAYISNTRKIKEFRDANLPYKNYRILDMAAWDLDKYITDLYWPLLEDYDPKITTEQYVDLMKNTDVIPLSYWETPYMIYKYGGEATCKNLEKTFGKKQAHYNISSTHLAKKVYEITQCPLYENRNKFWTILYRGKSTESKDEGSWVWRLRDTLWQAIEKLDEEDYFLGAFDEEDEGLNMDVKHDLNTILYGPPGTGKTYHTVIYAVAIIESESIDDISSESYDDVKARFDEYKKNGQIVFTTFHQSFGYEEFIEGIKPTVGLDSDNISYKIEDGLFKRLCEKAVASEQVENSYVMIIDEINRGNISKIFGELITLIEDTKRDGCAEATTVTLPYSGENFSIPSNVYLLGTMNTADRSIALMDTALRRRFSFVEMMPDPEVLKDNDAYIVRDGNKVLDVALMLDVINQRIEYLFDREHTIGHAFFMPLKDNPTVNQLAIIFKKKIIPLLQEYFYEDYEKIQLVLGDNKKSDEKYCFITNARQTASSIFNGNPELDQVAKYSINNDALKHIESYIEIIRNSSVT